MPLQIAEPEVAQVAEEEAWTPNLAPRQWDVFNCFSRALLVAGGRLTGKTVSVCHKVWRHLWDTPGARVALVSRTQRVAKMGGVWEDLIKISGPEWMESGMIGETGVPIEYTTRDGAGRPGPKTELSTRSAFLRIRNRWGGESELILYSLDDDDEVEAKLKSTRFSLIWFSELSNFKNRKVFDVSRLQLRMPHLNFEDHQWIADTNPAEEGEDSWIWKLWYEERTRKDHPKPEFQEGLQLIEFRLADNIFLDKRQIDELEGTYSTNPGEYDRNVRGIWTKGTASNGKIFADLLSDDMFIDGAIEVSKDTEELYCGWDLGNVYSSFVILEKRNISNGDVWLVLDEVHVVDERVSTAEFTGMALSKMLALEAFYGRTFKWIHWSDNTALTVYRPGIDGFDASEVLRASGGQIELQAVDKPAESVRACVKILRRKIREKRFFVGRNCPRVIGMLENLSAGKKYAVEDTAWKDAFDATRYVIWAVERDEITDDQVSSSSRGGVAHI